MSQAYHCPPTSLWQIDPATPKGFYFNRGVFYFGRKVENDMATEEARIRKAHKSSPGTDRLANAARLAILEKNIGVPVKRHRNPDDLSSPDQTKENEDEIVLLQAESG